MRGVAARRVAVARVVRRAAVTWSGTPSISASCVAVWGRSAGVLASAARIASSTSSGTVSRTTWRLGTTSMAWRAMMARALGPVNGGCPISISYNTQPRLYRSLVGTNVVPHRLFRAHVQRGPDRGASLRELGGLRGRHGAGDTEVSHQRRGRRRA